MLTGLGAMGTTSFAEGGEQVRRFRGGGGRGESWEGPRGSCVPGTKQAAAWAGAG